MSGFFIKKKLLTVHKMSISVKEVNFLVVIPYKNPFLTLLGNVSINFRIKSHRSAEVGRYLWRRSSTQVPLSLKYV